MSESSNVSDETPQTWGTPESHWPFPRPVAAPEPEDRRRFQALTPEQRVSWLLMILRLLEKQFGHLVKARPPGAAPAAPPAASAGAGAGGADLEEGR